MSQSIFVIGASGFVGSTLARHLLAEGQQVSGLARSDRTAETLKAAGIHPVAGDLDADLGPVICAA
jgi:uncharacterized protein YbjT (DUF2867 family)